MSTWQPPQWAMKLLFLTLLSPSFRTQAGTRSISLMPTSCSGGRIRVVLSSINPAMPQTIWLSMNFLQMELHLATMLNQRREFLLTLILSQTTAPTPCHTQTETATTILRTHCTILVLQENTIAMVRAASSLTFWMCNTIQHRILSAATRIFAM